ncbi:MAG: helix-turn-helix transcriptional regulator [Bacteroidales bacterium]|nr:helix-turn-helix transcriptional regulator [Bacteroidales bacterium]
MKNLKKSCPIEFAVDLMGGKWKLPILHALIKKSPKRFKVLEREIAGITPTMLTTQLRKLEADQLVHREIFATVPPTVEYSLTEHGETMKAMIAEIEKWGILHMQKLTEMVEDK